MKYALACRAGVESIDERACRDGAEKSLFVIISNLCYSKIAGECQAISVGDDHYFTLSHQAKPLHCLTPTDTAHSCTKLAMRQLQLTSQQQRHLHAHEKRLIIIMTILPILSVLLKAKASSSSSFYNLSRAFTLVLHCSSQDRIIRFECTHYFNANLTSRYIQIAD